MSASYLLQISIFSFATEGYTCPPTQDSDTSLICHIFQSTNIEAKIPHNFSDNNYCNWSYYGLGIGCSSPTSTIIDWIDFEYSDGLNIDGILNLSYKWPTNLKMIDLEQSWSSLTNLYGEWDWSSMQSLRNLTEINLRYNEFSGRITNEHWNIITSLKSLKNFNLRSNNFETNFSTIRIEGDIISKIILLDLLDNNLYGTMNVKTDGFFSTFPDLKYFFINDNNVYGHFNNMDAISSVHLPNLRQFYIANNKYSGSLSLSNSLSFSPELTHFNIYKNNFNGSVQWEIFSNLTKMQYLTLSFNSFSGSINPVSLPSSLRTIYLYHNFFSGSVPWDIFSNLTALQILNVEQNMLSGSLSLSNGVSFPASLQKLHLDYNDFNGTIDWNIFENLNKLYEIDINGHVKELVVMRISDFLKEFLKIMSKHDQTQVFF